MGRHARRAHGDRCISRDEHRRRWMLLPALQVSRRTERVVPEGDALSKTSDRTRRPASFRRDARLYW